MAKAKTRVSYTSDQILKMCESPWQWVDQLREVAAKKGFSGSSIVPIFEVVEFLRKDLNL